MKTVPTSHTPFPYTTLFRSTGSGVSAFGESPGRRGSRGSLGLFLPHHVCRCGHDPDEQHVERETKGPAFHDRLPWLIVGRSEEHTSELQSPCNIVCRLLLDK